MVESQEQSNDQQSTGTLQSQQDAVKRGHLRKGPKGVGPRTVSTTLKGEVAAMNGKTFVARTDRGKPSQFKETLEALRLLASTEYKKDILYLEPLFKKLEAPVASPPLRPVGPVIASSDPSAPPQYAAPVEVDMDIYREEMKAYVAIKERLQAATISPYNIAWAQCSRIMKDKLRAAPTFATIEEYNDVASLLKEIRAICYQVESSICCSG